MCPSTWVPPSSGTSLAKPSLGPPGKEEGRLDRDHPGGALRAHRHTEHGGDRR